MPVTGFVLVAQMVSRVSRWKFTTQIERMSESGKRSRPGIVCKLNFAEMKERIVRRNLLLLGIAALALACAVVAQDPPAKDSPKKSASHASGGSAAKGKEVFELKCAMCHFADNDQKKIGPGLKGISKRGTFTVNGNKVTTDSLTKWIENGDSLMPGMKDSLEPQQIKDVVAYVKTL
jgi:cytochrome c